MKLEGFVDWDGSMWVKKIEVAQIPATVGKATRSVRRWRVAEGRMDRVAALARHKL